MLNNKEIKNGKLITFEGIDGSGKSTQIKKLKSFCKQNKTKNFFFTKEPGGSALGESTRRILLKNNSLSNISQILLLVASRYEHYKQLILPLMNAKKIIISDRFHDSTYAYQCGKDKNLFKLLHKLNTSLFKNIEPNLTILLDISPKIAMQRIKKRKSNDVLDKKTLTYYNIVRNNYLDLAKKNKRIKVFNALLKKDLLFDAIKTAIFNEIKK